MGAAQSSTLNKTDQPNKNLPDAINYLATHYILTQSFQDMVNLRDPKYCNDLVILTSDIIGEYLNEQQVKYMHQKMKRGVEINEIKEDSLLWIKNDDFKKLDVKTQVPKKRLCIGIAKQYIKIAHLFGAIVTTINPTYSYRDNFGIMQTVPLKDKNKIPSNVDAKLKRVNICSERINALINGQDLKSSDTVTIKPNFCDINVAKGKDGNTKSLTDEPGIPELELLYNDEYDFATGQFVSMSDNMKKKYAADVETFYKVFTGNSTKPDSVTNFSDIKLRDFASSAGCKKDSIYRQSYDGSREQALFKQYAEHIQKMIKRAQDNQNALLAVLDAMFVWKLNHADQRKLILINPGLNEESLDKLIADARKLIINCYITCENDFIKGLEIFESIVEKQIMDVTKSQIDRLEKTIQDTLVKSPSTEVNDDTVVKEEDVEDAKEETVEDAKETKEEKEQEQEVTKLNVVVPSSASALDIIVTDPSNIATTKLSTTASKSAVPESTASESAVPESTASESAVPESTASVSAASESALPESVAPESITKKETVDTNITTNIDTSNLV